MHRTLKIEIFSIMFTIFTMYYFSYIIFMLQTTSKSVSAGLSGKSAWATNKFSLAGYAYVLQPAQSLKP